MRTLILTLCVILNYIFVPSTCQLPGLYIKVEGNTPGAETCNKPPVCNANSKYRTADGTCNNLNKTTWGAARTLYIRLLPAEFEDGYKEIRKAKDGSNLPNARLISTTIFPDIYIEDKYKSQAFMMWGQVLAHDTAGTGFTYVPDCCPNGRFANPPNPKCSSLTIPFNDAFYSQFNVTCMPLVRLNTTENLLNCKLKPQQQVSVVSQWIDLSMLYGNDDATVKNIREMKGGRLKTSFKDGEITLPISYKREDFCRITSSNQSCFETIADGRINQNMGNAVLTIVLLKEHNRISNTLAKINPAWSDEKLYQEARRINIAQALHITYSEFLPNILAPPFMDRYKLGSLMIGYTEYDNKIRGMTINEFTGSIYRTFHSLVQGSFKMIGGGSNSCPLKSAALGDYFWTVADTTTKCYNQLAKGLLSQASKIYKEYVTVQLSQYFQRGNKPYGDDLIAIDVIRGRESGFSSYNNYRKLCGLKAFTNFQELKSAMDPQVVDKLETLYKSIDDIELYVGAFLENHVPQGLTGPLAQCIIAQQFGRWKYGDRFYYEHMNQTGSFTEGQLSAIKKVTISSLMCRNANIAKIQKNGFNQVSATNNEVPCNEIAAIDLTQWKE